MVYTNNRETEADLQSRGHKAKFGTVDGLSLTGTALKTAFELGFGRQQIVDKIQEIDRSHFEKSMTSYANSKVWQDVYNVPHEETSLYVKFTSDAVTEFKLLSFKENRDD